MVGATVRQLELGGDGGDAEGPVGVPPPGIQVGHVYDSNTWDGQGMVISPGGGSTISHRTTPHNGVHQETAGNYSEKMCMPPHLLTLRQVGAEARDETDDDMVVP